MTNDTSEKKDSILKVLAITGFIGIIIIIAWASIQLVSVVPSAFSSLASLAESVNQRDGSSDENAQEREVAELTVTSDTLLVNAGEVVNINWDTTRTNGSYVFSYNCYDGVAIDLISETGTQSIQCGSNYNLGNIDSTALSIDSEKNRYTDITYSVSFLGTNDTRPRAAGSATLTVLNADITSELAATDDTAQENSDDTVTPDTTTPETETEAPVTPTTPTQPTTPSAPVTPEYVQEYVYAIPTSNPNGTTDLATRYLFLGEIVNNQFVPGAITREDDGALQFEVKNIGTKTSNDWSFSMSLPGGGTYQSDTQSPLKPNERAVLTVGFSGADISAHTFAIDVTVRSDRNQSNNDFSQRVAFIE